jgi:tRNA threonylcarbamoyladenosine biosynthesis protein TsaB
MLSDVDEALLIVMKMLLMDTCCDVSRLALSEGEQVTAQTELPRGRGSAEIVNAVAALLQERGLNLGELDAVGVVSGPGSFTGVRVGIATAKGLCEGASLKMIAVSRLKVLADAVRLQQGVVALDGGRGELYLGAYSADGGWREWVGGVNEAAAVRADGRLYVAEAKVAETVGGSDIEVHELRMEDVLRTVLLAGDADGVDMALTDANYLRREDDIYKKQPADR